MSETEWKRLLADAIETALRAAYARGYAWGCENPASAVFLPKAAGDYADKVMSDPESPLHVALKASPPTPGV